MSSEIILVFLRVVSAALLLLFLSVIVMLIWRDLKVALRSIDLERRIYGRLIVGHQTKQGFLPTGSVYPLLMLTSIGRSPTNGIAIEDDFVSVDHAVIALRDGQWWIEDRQSLNGTMVNGDRLTEPMIITSGDLISIGRLTFRLEVEEPLKWSSR